MTLIDRLKAFAHVDPYQNFGSEGTYDRLKKLLSPRWVAGKVALTLYERRHPDHPWITRDAILVLEGLLRRHHRGLEWGSGNGTCWLARRCRSLVSIEHNERWYRTVRASLEAKGVTNVDYRQVSEEAYAGQVDGFADESLDFVVVDGLFRGPTFLRSIPKVKQDGFIIFDNANWYLPSASRTPHSRTHADGPDGEELAEVARLVRDWQVLWTTNNVNDTAIFIKPVR